MIINLVNSKKKNTENYIIYYNNIMKTLKELDKYLYNQEWWNPAYFIWYKDAVEWIFNDIVNSNTASMESIEKYLQDLLIN
jgi:hypothetical protein